jgi:hypothetical protein
MEKNIPKKKCKAGNKENNFDNKMYAEYVKRNLYYKNLNENIV